MAGNTEAADARAATTPPNARSAEEHASVCLDCGAQLDGTYCSRCGQSSQVHRSAVAVAHNILHGVLHLDGRLFRTLPALILRPGRLTRRYIDGERTKFLSPTAMFLGVVFLMFAVFSSTGGLVVNVEAEGISGAVWRNWTRAETVAMERRLASTREQLSEASTEQERAQLERRMSELASLRRELSGLREHDWSGLTAIERRVAAAEGKAPDPPPSRLQQSLIKALENPRLLSYKLRTNAYKFSWLLIPLSVPLLWLMFAARSDVHVYDHAVFVTYSVTFMSLLVTAVWVAALLRVPQPLLTSTLLLVPPVHMYLHLRDTYGLNRAGALVRLLFLVFAVIMVLITFLALLVLLGVL